MLVDIKKASMLHLNEESIISYGGTSKIHKLDDDFCFKEYKERVSLEVRQIIKENIIRLSDTKIPNSLISSRFCNWDYMWGLEV